MADLRTDTKRRTRLRFAAALLMAWWPLAVSRAAELPVANPAEQFAQSVSTPTAPEKVVDIQIRGNKSLPLNKILPSIRTRVGRNFDSELIEEDVRRLDRTHMFVNVRTYWRQVPGGRIVVFDLEERPLLQEVKFVGCKEISRKTLDKEAGIKVGDAVDPVAIEEARRKLEEFYHKKGFAGARLTLIEGNKPEDRRAIFLINEGMKQKVWNTVFVGNTIASDDRLRTQIGTSRPFLFLFGGELDRKKLDEDVEKLTAYYRGLGFFRARIGRELEFNEKANWVTINFVIDEGPRYKIRNVSVIGNSKYNSVELLTDVKLKNAEYFNQSKLTADLTAMQDKYGGIGYVFADIKADPRFLEEPGQLDLVYNIKEGDRYTVGKINVNIKGEYPHTQITTILNRLSFKPGDIVDVREIRASERRIRASQLFENNPANGSAPKIVYNPPDKDGKNSEQDDATQVADKPKAGRRPGSKYRGQSPDPTPRDRDLDLTLDCGRYIGPQEEGGRRKAEGGTFSTLHSPLSTVSPPSALRPPPSSDDLSRLANDYTNALAQANGRRQSPARLILTQYTTNGGVSNPATQPRTQLQWTSGTATSQVQSTTPAVQNPPTQPAPVQSAPAYAQNWPRQSGAPERPADSPQGPYMPGPIFNESSPFWDGSPDGGAAAPRPLNMDINTQETMTGRLMLGVGINSDAGLVGSIVLDEQNFDWTRFPNSWEDVRNGTAWRGAGQRFRMEAVPGTQVQRYMVNFQEPYLFNSAVSMGLSGYYYNRIYNEYTDQRLGGRVALGYQLTPDLSGAIAYRGEKINITNPIDPLLPALAEVTGRDLALHEFTFSLTHDKRDNAFLATEGHLFEASIGEVLGSFQYPKAGLDLRKYFTLYERPDGSGRHVLSLAGRAGYSGDNTPIYERFYAGGFSTIRGFQFRGASPTEFDPINGITTRVGGDFMLLASAEYLFPITADDMLRGVVFCDTGTVEPTISDWKDKYRVAPGFGLRIVVPAMGPAPIALDFAFPISWQPGDRQEMFSFFMGFGR